jgi:hypothetical protein
MTPKENIQKEEKTLQSLEEICENTRAIRRVVNRILDHLHESAEQVIYRMVRKGILNPVKIGRFLAFSKSDLDYVIVNGEKKRTPGRRRKIKKNNNL